METTAVKATDTKATPDANHWSLGQSSPEAELQGVNLIMSYHSLKFISKHLKIGWLFSVVFQYFPIYFPNNTPIEA